MIKRRLSLKVIAREMLVLAAIFLIVYLGNQHVQAWLGKRAIENTTLEHISFTEALDRAQQQNKLILVDFAAIWCATCRKLDNEVLAKPQVLEIIRSDYIFVRLEYESEDREIFEKYGVTGFPTLMVMSSEGNPKRRLPLTLDATAFAALL